MIRFRIEIPVGVVLFGSLAAQYVGAVEPPAPRKPRSYLQNERAVAAQRVVAGQPNAERQHVPERAILLAPPGEAGKTSTAQRSPNGSVIQAGTKSEPGEGRRARLARPAFYVANDDKAGEGEVVEKSPSDKTGTPERLPQPSDQENAGEDASAKSEDAPGQFTWDRDTENSAEAGRLELERFQGMALEGNPGLSEASARMEALRGKWIQAGLPPNPFIGYSGQQIASRGLAEQHGMVLGQTFITGRKLTLDQAAVSQEWSRARFEFEQQRLRILTDTAIAYYEAIAAQRKVELASELVVIGDQAVQTAEALFKAKERSKIDVLQAQVETETVRILLENANQRREAAWRMLGAVTGARDLPIQQLEGSLKDAPDDITWEVALGRLRTNSPELFAAMAEVERARWIYQRALKQNVPNVDVQAIPFQRDEGVKGWDGALQVGANIPVWNKNQGNIRESWMRIAVAEQAVDRIELGLQARLSLVFERYLAAQRQIARYEQDILPAAREQLELVTQVYRRGEADSLAVLVTRRTLAQTSLAYIDALRDRAAAASEIEGLLLKESLLNAPGP